MPTSANSQDLELAKFFTDVEPVRDWFDKAILADKLPKRLLVIWGVGDIGKSSLLRMFRLNCNTSHVPVGLASGDEAKSSVDVLTRWAEDLQNDGANLPTLFKTLERYRVIQAKVEDQAKATNKKVGDAMVKGAGKVAEAGAAAAVGAVVGSVIPGIGTIAGAIGGMGAEALADWLRGFLTKPDIDLYTDPSKKLTDDFLADVNQLAAKKRIVLMLDTYEQMTALDDWTRDVAQRLNENVLLVIAGRAMVKWGRQWTSWLMHAHVEELKPMTKRVMHELIRKYYATMRGGEPNSKQVNAIIEFSGGLPMVVNTAVQLWVKYGVEDFGAVKGEVVREVVERLREGVPPELYPLLETAAALRYFNKDILRTVSGMGDINSGYEELRRFPFVRSRAEGYALHDRVRDMIEENVRTEDLAKYQAVHERAAAYFEVLLQKATIEQSKLIMLERIYHRIAANEKDGFEVLLLTARTYTRHRNRLRVLLGDIHNYRYLIQDKNRNLWIDYYEARLAVIAPGTANAKELYRKLLLTPTSDLMLRAYILRDWGEILSRHSNLADESKRASALKVLEECLQIAPQLDAKLVKAYSHMASIYIFSGEWEMGLNCLARQIEVLETQNNEYEIVEAMGNARALYATWGKWHKSFYIQSKIESKSDLLRDFPYLQIRLASYPWALMGSGRYLQALTELLAAYNFASYHDDKYFSARFLRNLVFVQALQGNVSDSIEKYNLGLRSYLDLGEDHKDSVGTIKRYAALAYMKRGDFDTANHLLQEDFAIQAELNYELNIIENHFWAGYVAELQNAHMNADHLYEKCIKRTKPARLYYFVGGLVGITRVKYAQTNYAAIPPLLIEAEQLAQQYEYNDHLASLRLTQGHIAWDGHIPEWGNGFDAAYEFYKLALMYALRFNRFLLDEVLSGRPQGTPLQPIIPECMKRGEDGRKMLRALSKWWQTGKNDVGAPRPDTISPIPENIALLEAEKIAREREPGDGSTQTSVLQQIENASS